MHLSKSLTISTADGLRFCYLGMQLDSDVPVGQLAIMVHRQGFASSTVTPCPHRRPAHFIPI